jgi:hypothetical protein
MTGFLARMFRELNRDTALGGARMLVDVARLPA